MNIRTSAGIASIGATLLISASGAVAYTGQELEKDAKVNMAQASAIALKARPGKITDRELGKEKGGSGLRFSFDVNSRGTTYEVGIDAVTGKSSRTLRKAKIPTSCEAIRATLCVSGV